MVAANHLCPVVGGELWLGADLREHYRCMQVDIVYFEDCPSWRTTRQRLGDALARIGRPDTPVSLIRVADEADLRAAGFAGSPTILVDGTDLFPATPIPDALACRLYPTAGGLSGSPSVDDLAVALTERSRS